MTPRAQRRCWAATLWLTVSLLALWLAVSLLVPWYARDWHGLQGDWFARGWRLAAQGTLLFYLAIIVVYAGVMDWLEGRCLQASLASEPVEPSALPAS